MLPVFVACPHPSVEPLLIEESTPAAKDVDAAIVHGGSMVAPPSRHVCERPLAKSSWGAGHCRIIQLHMRAAKGMSSQSKIVCKGMLLTCVVDPRATLCIIALDARKGQVVDSAGNDAARQRRRRHQVCAPEQNRNKIASPLPGRSTLAVCRTKGRPVCEVEAACTTQDKHGLLSVFSLAHSPAP